LIIVKMGYQYKSIEFIRIVNKKNSRLNSNKSCFIDLYFYSKKKRFFQT